MDIVQATNAPEPVTLAGRVYPVRQLRIEEWAKLHVWLKTKVLGPVAQALKAADELRAAGVPIHPSVRDALFSQAQEDARKWPPRAASPRWFQEIDQAEGGAAQFLITVLEACGTKITEAEAADMAKRASEEEFDEMVRVSYLGDPKRPKPESPVTETTTGTIPTETTGHESSTR